MSLTILHPCHGHHFHLMRSDSERPPPSRTAGKVMPLCGLSHHHLLSSVVAPPWRCWAHLRPQQISLKKQFQLKLTAQIHKWNLRVARKECTSRFPNRRCTYATVRDHWCKWSLWRTSDTSDNSESLLPANQSKAFFESNFFFECTFFTTCAGLRLGPCSSLIQIWTPL